MSRSNFLGGSRQTGGVAKAAQLALMAAAFLLGCPPAFAQWASVTDYGATGDGSTDDTDDIQQALDENLTVYFPEPSKWYKVSTLQLKTSHTLIGPGKWDRAVTGESGTHAILKGDGSGILLNTGDLNAMPPETVRRITIRDISMHNTDYPVLRLEFSPDFLIQNSWIGTFNNQMDMMDDRPAIEGVHSYRGTIRDSFIGQSGTSWAISFRDNMNAVTIADNTITGGSAGNGIDIGLSGNVTICGNDMEICNGFGIRVSGDTDPGNGICTSIRIESNYMEQVKKPLSLGKAYIVRGGKICANYLANGTINTIDDPKYVVRLGRVEDVEISGNYFAGHSGMDEPFVKMVRVAAAGVTEFPVKCRIVDNWVTGVSDNFTISGDGLHGGHQSQIMALNVMKYDKQPATGVTRVYMSPVLSLSNAGTTRNWEFATPFGGQVDKVEIFDATGTIDGTLRIGCSGTDLGSEILAKDLTTLTFTRGAAAVSPTVPMMRPTFDSTLFVSSMTESGSFRVRIHYRN
jgi:hypothetical protein